MDAMRGKFILLTLMVFALDHLTKYLVSVRMELRDSIEVVPGYLRLSYVRNSGVAFGFFQDLDAAWKPYLLGGLAIVAVVVIVIYSWRMPSDRSFLQGALALTMGGILGNFTDRIMHGSVIDFIELHVKDSFHWPTFNIADSAITLGIAMLLIDTLRNPGQDVGHENVDSVQE
jgi:signal peptidase II